MAFRKKIEVNNSGLFVDYHVVSAINIDFQAKQSHVTMKVFASEELKRAGKGAIVSLAFDWNGDDFPFTVEALDKASENSCSLAYKEIKRRAALGEETAKFYADADDVLE